MNNDVVVMTQTSNVELKMQLKELKLVVRPQVIADIVEARAHGDLKENAEYHAAREKQGFVERRIAYLESHLSIAKVIDIDSLDIQDMVIFGCKVTLLRQEDDNSQISYQLVGEEESDASQGKISHLSPLAQAILGKNKGDIATLRIGGEKTHYEILEVGR